MTKLNTTASELLIYNPDTSEGFADTFVFEPEEKDEERFGRLMILVSFDTKTAKTPEISEAIASIMQNEYYRASEHAPEQQFEAAVKKVNEVLGDLASAGEVSWIGKINCIIAALVDDEIFLTSAGLAPAYLIRRHQLAQLNKDSSSVPLKPNPLKTFENILTGKLLSGDKFAFLSPGVLQYVEKPKLREIVDRFLPDIAARHLQGRLVSFKEKLALAALITNCDERHPTEASSTLSPAAATINRTPIPPPTSALRTPPASGPLARTSRILRSLATKTASTTKRRLFPLLRGKKAVLATSPSPSRIVSTAAPAGPISSRKPYTYTDLRPKSWWKKILIICRQLALKFWDTFARWFRRLPRLSKILFIVVVALVIAFIVSLLAIQSGKRHQAQQTIYDNRTAEARTKVESAEAALIYGNDSRARQLLDESEAVATEIQNSRYRNAEAAAILTKIEQDRLRLDHITAIDRPERIFDFKALGEEVQPTALALSGKYLLSYNADQPTLYLYQLDSKKGEALEVKTSGTLRALATDEKEAVLFSSAPALALYNFSGTEIKEAAAEFPPDQDIQAICLFGRRLYTLDSTHNRIQKYSLTVGGFSKGSDWLEDETSLSGGISLAVDGSLYVLTDNGQLLKFLKGSPADFTLSQLTNPLNHPTRLFTDDTTNNIYILDPAQKRLVVFDKEGALKDQYTSESFNDLKGMAVNEAERKAYLLNGTEILGIMLNES
jgi:hypothetical protein